MKHYTDEFKRQIVGLINSGRNPLEIAKLYNVARSTVHKWTKPLNTNGSFNANLTPEEIEIKELKKKFAYAEMENDILKQATLIGVSNLRIVLLKRS